MGVLAPKTFIPDNCEEAIQYTKTLDFPILLKPSVGYLYFNTFKKKMLFINNLIELENAYKKLGNFNGQMLIQEYIPGEDTCGLNYNSFFVNKKAVVEIYIRKSQAFSATNWFSKGCGKQVY